MKKGAWKKILVAFLLVMFASMAGSGLTGWINDKKTETEEKTDTENQASIECVIEA